MKADITVEEVRRLFTLEPEEGVLRNAVKRPGGSSVGSVAGWQTPDRRWRIHVGKNYLAHRLAWLHHYGEWPQYEIDHINGNVADNRLANLRDVPHRTNCENKRRPTAANKLGVQGVIREGSRFVAHVTCAGSGRRLGTYGSAEEAHAAYLEAKRALHEGCTL